MKAYWVPRHIFVPMQGTGVAHKKSEGFGGWRSQRTPRRSFLVSPRQRPLVSIPSNESNVLQHENQGLYQYTTRELEANVWGRHKMPRPDTGSYLELENSERTYLLAGVNATAQ
jgi:hypothetical protein